MGGFHGPGEAGEGPEQAPPAGPGLLTRTGRFLGRLFPELRPPLTPFGRLAVTHLLMVNGDAFMTVALAGSLFFSISPDAARGKVMLYLLLTMAPFAVVAPALGPLLDRSRGARRAMVMGSGGSRVVLCFFMSRDLHSLLLFPEAFLVLVASKLYGVGKAALVPAVVGDGPELVRANSRLALISGLASLAGALPAAAILKIPFLGAAWVLRADAVVLLFATLSAARLPRGVVAPAPAQGGGYEDDDTAEIPTVPVAPAVPALPPAKPPHRRAFRHLPTKVLAAASGMAVLRGSVGLVTFLLAFELRRQHAATWWYGAVLASSVAGSLVATLLTPQVRKLLREESILLSALGLVAVVSGFAYYEGGRFGDCLLAAGVGLGASTAKLAFDSMVQRDVHEYTRGRAFAGFETRFQLAWVVGAFVPVAVSLSDHAGELVVALAATAAGILYVSGRRLIGPGAFEWLRRPRPPGPGQGRPVGAA